MKVADVVHEMQSVAPPAYAAQWDNVGLLLGSTDWRVQRVLLAIDLTEAVLEEATRLGAGAVIAYHPPLFKPLRTLVDCSGTQRVLLQAAAARIAIYSPHTALDAAPGGVNDWLAEGLGAGRVDALEPIVSRPRSEQCKIVTFTPARSVDAVRAAMAEAGAGRIGDYEQCAFEIQGRGSFLGGSGTNPAVGSAGHLEHVDEIRFEMVCSEVDVGAVIAALRGAHPYEEPPVEVHRLEGRPQQDRGLGRRVALETRAGLPVLVDRVKKRLGVRQLAVAVGASAPRTYSTVGLCVGAGGSLIDAAIGCGCELFLTGEMRHHDVLAAQAAGCTIMLAGHSETERGYLKVLRKRLAAALPKIEFTVSRRDAPPLRRV